MKHTFIFDGVCGLCTRLIRVVIKTDKNKNVTLIPYQSAWAETWFADNGLQKERGKTVIYLSENKIFTRSDAILHLFNDLGGLWKLTRAFYIIPRKLRNVMYDFISTHRYWLFSEKPICNANFESKT